MQFTFTNFQLGKLYKWALSFYMVGNGKDKEIGYNCDQTSVVHKRERKESYSGSVVKIKEKKKL